MLILSKCGTLMRDMKDCWNICKLWDTCIYLKLKGNVSRCDQKIIMWVEFLTLVDAGFPARESVSTFTLSNLGLYSTALQFTVGSRQLINPWLSGQTGLHYADTGVELCSFQRIATMTDDHKREYICISGSQHSSLMSNVKVWLWLGYTENTQNKPTSPAQLASTQGWK